MKGGPIASQNKKEHPAHFLTFAVKDRITNRLLLLCHGDFPPGGVFVVVGSELRCCCDVIWGVIVTGNLTEHDQCLHIAGFVTRTLVLEAAYGWGEVQALHRLGGSLGLSKVAIPLAKQTSRVLVAVVAALSSLFPLSLLRHVG